MKTEIEKNIEGLKEAEAALIKSEKKLRDITSALGEGVYVINEQGELIFMNPEAERLLGWTEAELLGANMHATIHFRKPDNTELSYKDCPALMVFSSGETHHAEDDIFVRKDGTTLPVSYISSPIREDGKVVASVTAFRDNTIRNEMEKIILRARNIESIGVLAGGIAHDFNNLLTGIMSCISLAKETLEPEHEAYEILTMAHKASLQAKDLTYQLLTFSRSGSTIRQAASIADVLKDSVGFVMSGTNIKCEFHIEENLWPAEIDKAQINQVIHGLALNAREAMMEGGVITIRAENYRVTGTDKLPISDGNYVKISVSDQGSGITEENMLKIFDPYFTTKQLGTQKGTGLGLALCYTIIRNHDGYISADSKVGSGSTFTLYLPASSSSMTAPTAIEQNKASGISRILIMDDEKIIGQVAGMMLKRMGCETAFAENGEEAVSLYKKAQSSGQTFDMAILDLTIPGGSGGIETMKQLLEIDPDVRAIISSGYSEDPVLSNFREYGFKGVLQKPYEMKDLSAILHEVLRKQDCPAQPQN